MFFFLYLHFFFLDPTQRPDFATIYQQLEKLKETIPAPPKPEKKPPAETNSTTISEITPEQQILDAFEDNVSCLQIVLFLKKKFNICIIF